SVRSRFMTIFSRNVSLRSSISTLLLHCEQVSPLMPILPRENCPDVVWGRKKNNREKIIKLKYPLTICLFLGMGKVKYFSEAETINMNGNYYRLGGIILLLNGILLLQSCLGDGPEAYDRYYHTVFLPYQEFRNS